MQLKECGILGNNQWSESSRLKPTLASNAIVSSTLSCFSKPCSFEREFSKDSHIPAAPHRWPERLKTWKNEGVRKCLWTCHKEAAMNDTPYYGGESRLTLAHSCTCYCPPMPLFLCFTLVARPRVLMEFSALALETWCHPHKLGLFFFEEKWLLCGPDQTMKKEMDIWLRLEVCEKLRFRLTTGEGDQ